MDTVAGVHEEKLYGNNNHIHSSGYRYLKNSTLFLLYRSVGFALSRVVFSPSELARELGIGKDSKEMKRILRILVSRGVIVRVRRGYYVVGPQLVSAMRLVLGDRFLSVLSLVLGVDESRLVESIKLYGGRNEERV